MSNLVTGSVESNQFKHTGKGFKVSKASKKLLPMPGCWALTAAILMQKFSGSVKLTCPENQCHIMRRLENWKHEDLSPTGYIYNLYHYI